MRFSYTTFSNCVSDSWTLAIGDPNIMGWGVFAAYAVATSFALSVTWQAPFASGHRRQERVFWGLISLAMAALALNKQLDLQSLLTAAGRCLAKEQGWYENRRIVQRDFIFAMIALFVLVGTMAIWLLRGIIGRNLIALLGLTTLAGFVLLRGGHLFHIFVPDHLSTDILLHKTTSALEVLSPLLIIAAAGLLLRQRIGSQGRT